MKLPLPCLSPGSLCGRAALVLLCAATSIVRAQNPTGAIVGRVVNAGSGDYLNNARVSIAGTRIEALTDARGEFRLANAPAGDVRLSVSYTGFNSADATIRVTPGATARRDFDLTVSESSDRKAVVLDRYTVSERLLSGQAYALNEQRQAPNIKNVVSIEEFPDMGEGNVGEFIKFVPGVDLLSNPQSPSHIQIRGMPAHGTLLTLNGLPMATTGVLGRSVDLANAASGNIDRIEVTKTPTPDMPAHAVGGGVNMITKSGFGRKTPLFTYNLFATYTAPEGYDGSIPPLFRRTRGPDGKSSVSRTHPAGNLSYLLPLNDSLAFTFALNGSARYTDWQYVRPTWNKNTAVINTYSTTHIPLYEEKILANATLDWRVTPTDSLQFSAQYSKQEVILRQNTIQQTLGAGTTGDSSSVYGAPTGVGTMVQAFGWNNQHKPLKFATATYRHDGDEWKFDAAASLARASIALLDTEEGFFQNLGGTNITNLILRANGVDAVSAQERKIAVMEGVSRTGQPVNIFDGANYSLGTASTQNRRLHDETARLGANLKRTFDWKIPTVLKTGFAWDRRAQDNTSAVKTYTFTPPGGAAGRLASGHDVLDEEFSRHNYFTDVRGNSIPVRWITPTKVYQLFQQHPDWFVLNEAAAHTSGVNATTDITETIKAGYVRADFRLLQNKLWIVTGVRYEHTNDKGLGPLNDIRATYVQDANGNLVLNAAGNPTRITGSAFDLAKRQYTLKGAFTEKSYDGYYPSFNGSYSITDKLVVRAAYARTIGRPNFSEIIPTVTTSDPTAAPENRVVNVVNSGLKPWMADNYDLTLEVYEIKGAVAAVSLFRKDLTDFFSQTRTPATTELLAQFGLPDDYLGYDVVTQFNAGNAIVNGIEFSHRQSLFFLPSWARGLQAFFNVTSMDLSGESADDLTDFSPRKVNWGLSFTRPKFRADFTVNQYNWKRKSPTAASATVAPNSYLYDDGQTKIDVSLEYRFSTRFSLYGGVRNLTGEPLRRGNWAPNTPGYARVDQYFHTGAMFSVGAKGSF